MKKTLILPLLLSLLLIVSFFLWYLFALREYKKEYQDTMLSPVYIDVKTTTKSISVQDIPENIFLRVNGNIIQSGSIDLKE